MWHSALAAGLGPSSPHRIKDRQFAQHQWVAQAGSLSKIQNIKENGEQTLAKKDLQILNMSGSKDVTKPSSSLHLM